jgi:hypothetical protein
MDDPGRDAVEAVRRPHRHPPNNSSEARIINPDEKARATPPYCPRPL